MSEAEGRTPITEQEVEHALSQNGGGSLRDRARAARETLKKKTHLDLRIPGYDDFMVRYRTIPGEQVEAVVRKVGPNGMSKLMAADLLIKTCDCVLVRVDEDGEFDELVDDQDVPIKLDLRLAEFFGFEAEKARQVVFGVFSPEGNQDLAVVDVAGAVLAWLQGRENEIDRALLGE